MSLIRMMVLIFLSCSAANSFGQYQKNMGKYSYRENNPLKKFPSVGIGGGINRFFGDKGSAEKGILNGFMQLKADHQLSKVWAIDVNIAAGYLTQQYKKPYQLYDFKMNYFNSNVIVRVHLAKFSGRNRNSMVAPFIASGSGYMYFETYRNLYSPDNYLYSLNDNYVITDNTGNSVLRDDDFETRLSDIENHVIIFLFGGGVKMNFSEHVELCADAYYIYTGYDFMEGKLSYLNKGKGKWIRSEANNYHDGLLQVSLTLMYSFGYNSGKRSVRCPYITR